MKKYWRSHILILKTCKQHIGDPNSEANICIGVYITNRLRHQFWIILHLTYNSSKTYSPRKRTPVKYEAGQEAGFPVVSYVTSMNVRLMALSYKDISVTLMSGKTMVTLLRRILSQTNSIYRNIFVSVFSWLQKNHLFHYFGLLHRLLHRQDLLNKLFWMEVTMFRNASLYFWKRYLTR